MYMQDNFHTFFISSVFYLGKNIEAQAGRVDHNHSKQRLQ